MKRSTKSYFGLHQVPTGIGAMLKGWDISWEDRLDTNRIPVLDFRAMGPQCPNRCPQCYTQRGEKNLSLDEIKRVIFEAKEEGARAINFVGEGEPTFDPDFMKIVRATSKQGIVPVVFTEAASKLADPYLAQRLYAVCASVVIKLDSMFDARLQDEIVGRPGYFQDRQSALVNLIKVGFNDYDPEGTTRLGFNMLVTESNYQEVPEVLRFCRQNNIWVIFAFHLPGTGNAFSVPLSYEKRMELMDQVKEIDFKEFGFDYFGWNNFITMPCMERLQVLGDGTVTACPGSNKPLGSVRKDHLHDLNLKAVASFEKLSDHIWDGHCPYRDS